jgi:two-component system, OmpR family, response regulator
MKKLLLVEDEEALSFLYKKQFEVGGYEVDTVRDGIRAVSVIQSNNTYDLVLLDIMLPGMNGINILKTVKSDDKTKHIPIIMLTNLVQDEVMQEAFKYGAAGFWVKAEYSPSEIVSEINKFFEKQTPLAENTPIKQD